MTRPTRAPRAFTLVELLVVIGIIAVLIGILLPVLSGVQARGRDLKCQSNLRSFLQLVMVYAAENKGSLPYGWYYNRSDNVPPPAGTGAYAWTDLGGDERLTTCFSLISRLAGKHYRGDDVFIASGQTSNPEAAQNAAPFLKCPEAQLVYPHICSYVVQFVAFITPYYDRQFVSYPKPIQDKPARTKDLMNFTILVHDTAIFPGMSEDIGYVGDADVDQQRMWRGAENPQWRYFNINDPYSRIGPGTYGNNRPVAFPGTWFNIDPEPAPDNQGFAGYPYQGNLRFRHNKNTSVNVGYADGRVESISAKFHPDKSMRSHTVPRKSFMIKWPSGSGIAPNPAVP